MPNETLEKPAQPPKKIHRVRIGVNVLVQVALILFLAVMVNYLGFEHYRRWDHLSNRVRGDYIVNVTFRSPRG